MFILLDQDGVLSDHGAELYTRWADQYPEEFDRYHIPLDQAPYDLTSHFGGEVTEHLKAIEQTPGFWASLPPIDGALEGANELVALGHVVCICTRPSKRVTEICALEKFQWVQRRLGQAWIERMMVVRDKTFAHGDILIDDKPKIVGAREPSWQHVIFDQPYNRHVADRPRFSWSINWRDALSEIEDARRRTRLTNEGAGWLARGYGVDDWDFWG